jgi:predicted dehydrogenase
VGVILTKREIADMEKIKVLLIGAGGYGNQYVDVILDKGEEKGLFISGIVDPNPQGCARINELVAAGARIYDSTDSFYSNDTADLAVISSPIQYHKAHILSALKNGSNVLCEKPLCAGSEDAYEIVREKQKSGKIVGIGYQWSYSDEICKLKKDIKKGIFGKPGLLKTIVLWPRTYNYYNRNKWAGKIVDECGRLVLDSIANNAAAHYLHNMFFVLGSEPDTSAKPVRVTAELYRAKPIESFDTCSINVFTEVGAQILFIASHAVKEMKGPCFEFEFEKALITYDNSLNTGIIARFKDGREVNYGDPNAGDNAKKLWSMADSIRTGKIISCPPEAALSHAVCIDAVHRSCTDIVSFPQTMIIEDDLGKEGKSVYAKGIDNILESCYSENIMISETGVQWGVPQRCVTV